MSTPALELIRKAKETQAAFLDLGNCGLRELPEELFTLTALEGLSLSDTYYDFYNREWIDSSNNESHNQLNSKQLEPLGKLKKLKQLHLRGVLQDTSENATIIFLDNLPNLQILDLGGNDLTEVYLPETLSQLQYLYLSRNKLTKIFLPETLGQLQYLYIKGNKLTVLTLPEGLSHLQYLAVSQNFLTEMRVPEGLTRLQHLDVSDNQLKEISFPENLDKLKRLNLSRNQLEKIVLPQTLNKLKRLNLEGNRLRKVALPDKLSHLQYLYLSRNLLTEINIPAELNELQHLYLSDNQLTEITLPEGLNHLLHLYLSNNQLTKVSFATPLNQLQYLYLRANRLTTIALPKNLNQLQYLDVSDNQLTNLTLPNGLSQLQHLFLNGNKLRELTLPKGLHKLQRLYVSGNQITTIAPTIALLQRLQHLVLDNNPLKEPPLEICQGGIGTIRSWFLSQGKIKQTPDGQWILAETEAEVDMMPLYEAKIVLVGNGEVGKTSIALKLQDLYAPLPKPEERTHGLAVYRMKKDIKPVKEHTETITFTFNIWDFGGQGKFRAVQQFFCSRTSLYLYVTSPDENDHNRGDIYQGFDYWLNMVRAFSFDIEHRLSSPVIHVHNKKDLKVQPIDEATIHNYYPQIHPETIRISCKTLEGLDQLERTIEMILPQVSYDIFTRRYSPAWLAVKETLEEKAKETTYMAYQAYLTLAQDKGLTQFEAEHWLDTLDRIGTVIHFGKIEALKDLIVLQAEWVKEAAYAILQSEKVIRNYGSFNELDFPNIWQKFKQEEYAQLIALMLAFELCYQIKDPFGRPLYLMPALFPETPPAYQFEELMGKLSTVYQVRLTFQPFYPAGLLHRLMVRKNDWVHQWYRWRQGVIVHHKGTYAEVIENWQEKLLEVKIVGDQPKAFFHLLQQEITDILDDFKHTKMIAQLDTTVKGYYQDKWRNMADLQAFKVDFWKAADATAMPDGKPEMKVFISYAHAHDDYYKAFYDNFKSYTKNLPFVRLNIFTDERIALGSDWHKKIQQEAAACDVAILLVSDHFMTSDYIKEHEVTVLIERIQAEGVLVVPIYFYPCRFYDWEVFKKTQFFKPKGADYGRPDRDKKNRFCYADLVEFDYKDGIPILMPNPARGDYMMDFIDKLEPELKRLIATRKNT